jgi:hydroxyacid-oxoacid transhydrogenase
MPESGQVIREIAFEMAASSVRFGAGVTREAGMDLVDLGVRKALVVTDPNVARLAPVHAVLTRARCRRRGGGTLRSVRVEPTDVSFRDAIDFAGGHRVDGIVAVGGGSVIDTAKAVNLYTSYPPADFLDYVNAPIGKAIPVPGPLKPLIAIPTTAGTGSETTGVSIFDLTEMHAKTGIASRRLKPTLGLLDPDNTRTMPPQVAASSGLDILSHASSRSRRRRIRRVRGPSVRHCGRPTRVEPISDIWALQALRIGHTYLVRAVEDPSDDDARAQMILAASYAGMGFGNAGVHLPMACRTRVGVM